MKRSIFAGLLPAAALLASAAALNADTIGFHVNVDTSSIASAIGFIEIQFNQVNAGTSLPATATVSNFTSAGFTFDNSSNFSLGGVSGSFSSPPLVIHNDVGATNLFDQGVAAFGSSFGFSVLMSGPAIGGTSVDGSSLFLFLLGTDFSPLIGSLDNGEVANIQINGNGSVTAHGSNVATVATVVPEAPMLPVVGLGLAALYVIYVRRRA